MSVQSLIRTNNSLIASSEKLMASNEKLIKANESLLSTIKTLKRLSATALIGWGLTVGCLVLRMILHP